MEELLARFLQYMDSLNSGSVHTRAAYQRDIREFISFLQEEGIEELQDADRIIVMNYIASLREKPGVSGEMKNSTIARKLSSLRSLNMWESRRIRFCILRHRSAPNEYRSFCFMMKWIPF